MVAAYLSKLMKSDRVFTAEQIRKKRENSLVSTGSVSFDWALGGGIPRNEMTLLWGPAGCLSGDTVIPHVTMYPNGKVQKYHKTTLKKLYERFHKRVLRVNESEGLRFMVSSIDENKFIIKNSIVNVVFSGHKECYELITESGLKIKATKDHRFYNGETYVKLEDICVGDTVLVDAKKRISLAHKSAGNIYKHKMVKYHPAKRWKEVVSRGVSYLFCRVKESRAVIEADMNGMSYHDYIDFLNTRSVEDIDKLKILDPHAVVHHLNEDKKDNRLENLVVTTQPEHATDHSSFTQIRLLTCSDRVASIISVGYMDTYDIQCQDPYNNFIANGFVVHNSGKSSEMYKMLAKEQNAFPNKIAIIFDSEYSFSPERAESMGVNIAADRLLIIQGNRFDDCVAPLLQAEKEMIAEKNVCFIGVDSVKGFVSASLENLFDDGKAEGTANLYGGIAKTLNPLLDILNRLANEAECMVILTNHAAANLDARMAKYYPYVLTGGMKLRHLVGTCAFMEKSTSQAGMLRDANDVAIGGTFRIKVTKTRRTTEGKQAEFLWNLMSGDFVEQELELANLAKDLHVFEEGEKANSLVFKEGDQTHFEAKNLPAAANQLKQRPGLFSKVLEACNRVAINPTLGVATDEFIDDSKDIEEETAKKKGKKK